MQVRLLPWAPVPACRGVRPSLPALEAGDRWFKSTHADQSSRAGRAVRRRILNPFRQVRFLCAPPISPVAKQERGGLQNRHEPGQHRPGLPSHRNRHLSWRVGRAARQRSANASSPSGCTGSIPVLSAITRPSYNRLFLCGRGVVGCVPVFQTGGVGSIPAARANLPSPGAKGYGAFNAGRRGLNSHWQDHFYFLAGPRQGRNRLS